MPQRIVRSLAGFSLALFLFPFRGSCGDWLQFRGPTHDGISTERIKTNWTGLNPTWLVPVPNSLCGFVVSGGRAFTQVNREINLQPKEVCVALDITNGAELWATVLDDANYPDGFVGYDDGPRTTPSFDNGSVYVLTSYLKLYRLNATNGAVIWQKDLLALYGGTVIRFQNAASPLIDSGLIYLNANCGSSNLMALRTSDGSVAWRVENESMTHSTPVLATLFGVRQLVFATGSGLISLDPLTGARLWRFNYPFTFNSFYSLAVSPVVHRDMVFMSGTRSVSYTSFVRRITYTNNVWSSVQLWSTNEPSSTFTTPVAKDGFLYGTFGFDTTSPLNQLKCVEMRTGLVKWSQTGFGRGGLLMVDNKYLMILTEKCELVLAQVNTNAYVELGRIQALPPYNTDNNKSWNVPAIADGKVYVRSTSWGAAFDMSVPQLPGLLLDPPTPSPGGRFDLSIRPVNGTALDSNRAAGIEVWTSTNAGQPLAAWTRLTNGLTLTNGIGRILGVEGAPTHRYFILREPFAP
jgi:outer membrane protein assembly factor BamB